MSRDLASRLRTLSAQASPEACDAMLEAAEELEQADHMMTLSGRVALALQEECMARDVGKIDSPGPTADIADRLPECEEALERAFQDLVERAERAGWDTIEITVALQSLADHHMLAKAENAGTDAMITFANDRRRLLKGD